MGCGVGRKSLPCHAVLLAFLSLNPGEPKLVPSQSGASIQSRRDGSLRAVAFSPDGALLAFGGHVGKRVRFEQVQIYSTQTWKRVALLEGTPQEGHDRAVRSLAITPDGKYLAAAVDVIQRSDASTPRGEVRIWEVATGRAVESLPACVELTNSLAVSPIGSTVAFCRPDGRVAVWDIVERRLRVAPERAVPDEVEAEFQAVAFSPDGATLASVDLSDEGSILSLWSVSDLRKRASVRCPSRAIECLAFSPDGATLAAEEHDDSGPVRSVFTLRDPRTGQVRRALHSEDYTHNYYAAAFSPDGRTLATCDSGRELLRLWDVADGRVLHHVAGPKTEVAALDFSPDGTLLATVGANGLLLWDVVRD